MKLEIRFDMPAATITPELKKDLQLLKVRTVLFIFIFGNFFNSIIYLLVCIMLVSRLQL